MDKNHKETIRVRAISVGFAVLALGVFKPFGLDEWKWNAYIHLLLILMLGFGVCCLTEVVLKYVARMPRPYKQGDGSVSHDPAISGQARMALTTQSVDYIIRRNLWFQLINTPLVSLMICFYRHFVLSDRVPNNQLSWSNYFETLAIMAFISFAIGLYWRFKFRSRFLATELEETRQLNEQLKAMQMQAESKVQSLEAVMNHSAEARHEQPSKTVTLTGTTSESVTLNIADLLFVETIGNYVKVYHLCGGVVRSDMLRATSKQMEDDLRSYPMIVRCHRAFLVNLAQVEQIVAKSASMQLIIKHSHDSIPVSRSNISQIKDAIKNV